MDRVVKVDHYDSYRDDNLQVVIRANGQIIIQKAYDAFSNRGDMITLEFEEYQRIVNIITAHQQIKNIKGDRRV